MRFRSCETLFNTNCYDFIRQFDSSLLRYAILVQGKAYFKVEITMSVENSASTKRDKSLDVTKGLAILLVVLGHTFQGLTPKFDDLLGFRIIYSFHMPFFVLLSGVAAASWFNKFSLEKNSKDSLIWFGKRFFKTLLSLLTPFFVWTIINYKYHGIKQSLTSYLMEVLRHNDISFWFLPCIFWCVSFLIFGLILIRTLNFFTKYNISFKKILGNKDLQILLIFMFWMRYKNRLPGTFGFTMVNNFHHGLFFYFLLGVMIHRHKKVFTAKLILILSFLIFVTMAPFWSRLSEHQIVKGAPNIFHQHLIEYSFSMIVAITGSLTFFNMGEILTSRGPKYISRGIAHLGSSTMGIYIMQYYFLAWRPLVLAPVVLSLLITNVISGIPVVNFLLLGKIKNLKISKDSPS